MSHLARVRSLPCVICRQLGVKQESRTYSHHPRFAAGGAQKAPDTLAIPLCYEHHQGKTGIHGDRSAWNVANLDEAAALAIALDWQLGGMAANEVDHETY